MNESRIRQEAAVLEDFHRLLEFLTRRTLPPDAPRLNIYLVDNRGQMLIIRPGLGKDVLGFYDATPGGILAVALEPTGDQSWFGGRDILLHEYAHHFMMQAGNSALPAWYVEGFAEYMMTAEFRPDRIDFGGVNNSRYFALTSLPWAPLEQVLRRAPGVDGDSFYAQSWLLTHYLNRVEGMQPKRDAYLRKVDEGADPVEAFRQEIDPDLKAFQGRLRSYLNGRSITFSRMKRKPPEQADVRITRLSDAADAALLPLVAVQLPQKAEHDAANLARVRQAAARTPDDPWAQRALAIAEAAVGDKAAAAARLDALLAQAPADPELLRWRARLHGADSPSASAADVSAARRLLVRAFKAAPNDWLVLSDYVETFEARGQPLPDGVLEVLAKAFALAPQESSLAYRTAMAMAKSGDYAIARAAMAPLVNDPHGGRAMVLERTLLDALRSGDKAAVEAALAGLALGGSVNGTD
jgi:tetratricopeptide (TPR) repeat protein